MHLVPLNCTFNNGYNGEFYYTYKIRLVKLKEVNSLPKVTIPGQSHKHNQCQTGILAQVRTPNLRMGFQSLGGLSNYGSLMDLMYG